MKTLRKTQDVIYPTRETSLYQDKMGVKLNTLVNYAESGINYGVHFTLEEFEEIARGVIEDLEAKRASEEKLEKLKIETDADYKVYNRTLNEEMDKKIQVVGLPYIPYEQLVESRLGTKGWFLGYYNDKCMRVETTAGVNLFYTPTTKVLSVRKSGKNYNAPCKVSPQTFDEIR